MDISTSSLEGGAKKVALEDMSKEDLIKKCRNLLVIAQKAKQTKDSINEENNALKEKLKNVASIELVENLTQQKLMLVTDLHSSKQNEKILNEKLSTCEAKLLTNENKIAELDTENLSYKRQVNRLTDENEHLLTYLEELEKQIEHLKKIGLEQQEQLLLLEKSNVSVSENVDSTDGDKQMEELQKMLSVTLNEVKKLQNDNKDLIDKNNAISSTLNKNEEYVQDLTSKIQENQNINSQLQSEIIRLKDICRLEHNLEKETETLQILLSESAESIQSYQKEIELKNKEIEKHTNKTDDLNTEIHKNRALIQKLNQDVANMSNKLKDNQIVSSGLTTDLQNTNEKMKEKLKQYHSKMIKFVCEVKKLKEDKEYILEHFKKYNKQVSLWKEQLVVATEKLSQELKQNEMEKLIFRNKNIELKLQIDELIKEKEAMLKKQGTSEEDTEQRQKLHQENRELNNRINEVTQEAERLQLEIDKIEKDNKNDITKSCLDFTNQIEHLNKENLEYQNQISQLNEKIDKITKDNLKILSANNELKLKVEAVCDKLNSKEKDEENALTKVNFEKEILEKKTSELNEIVEENNKLILELRKAIEHLESELERSKLTETKLAEKSGEEILKLAEKNSILERKLEEFESKFIGGEDESIYNELQEKVNSLKRENAELLTEMNEMNQALKERGETISKQQSYCDEILKKIAQYESQVNLNGDTISQNNETIRKLQEEIEELKKNNLSQEKEEIQRLQLEITSLKEKLNNADNSMDSNYAESETLSTSTISKADEVNRMKDLEGSWEERYGKLRTLALKLKGKVRELSVDLSKEQSEKADMQQKLAASIKTTQTMQVQYDKLQDDLETTKSENRTYIKQLEGLSNEISKNKKKLAANEETINKHKSELEALQKEKLNLDAWKKQVSAKVQSLKKELESNALIKKDFESKIQKLNQDLENKEKTLREEKEKHLQTRNSLQESNNECKKQSVLNLEMQDYERSIKELSQKLEKKNDDVAKLKNQLDSHKGSTNALKEQNQILEEKSAALETEIEASRIEINTFKIIIADLEAIIAEKDLKIQDIFKTMELARSENEDLGTQLSKVIADHQKINDQLKIEKDHLRSENLGLEQRIRELEDRLKLKVDELGNIQHEYQGYKVRAQSVLRQNQTRDIGMEEKLTEEAATLRAQVEILKNEVDYLKSAQEKLNTENENILAEKAVIELTKTELLNEIEECKNENKRLSSRYQQMVNEHAETVRSLRIHADTLAQCYRQQISEQEVRHNREIIELQSKLEKGGTPPEFPSLVLPTTPREEGEGSESVDSANGNVHPLEKLLGTDQDHEISLMKKQLNDNESKVAHLTALLADTEQDLAKHVQMNKVLKEEIRRQQRSVEREKHAENLEYMKNVVFKFITLSSGDERQRLVPVLNTILKLSPEETQKLNMVAKNDKSWSNYLPTWSSSNKPQ